MFQVPNLNHINIATLRIKEFIDFKLIAYHMTDHLRKEMSLMPLK
jgi:hypothetical protein